MNNISADQLQALQDSLANHKPIPISIHMTEKGFDFVTTKLRIFDKERYRIEQGIQIVNKHSTLTKYQARVIYSDNSSKLINLREEK